RRQGNGVQLERCKLLPNPAAYIQLGVQLPIFDFPSQFDIDRLAQGAAQLDMQFEFGKKLRQFSIWSHPEGIVGPSYSRSHTCAVAEANQPAKGIIRSQLVGTVQSPLGARVEKADILTIAPNAPANMPLHFVAHIEVQWRRLVGAKMRPGFPIKHPPHCGQPENHDGYCGKTWWHKEHLPVAT